MSNEQAVELFNFLNSLEPKEGSHQQYAQIKTIRNMKKVWLPKHQEILQDIDDDNCAVEEDVSGAKILLKKILKRTEKNKKGEDVTVEFQVPVYTKEGEKKRKAEIRQYMKKPAIGFEIHSTSDASGLNPYEIETLRELGFIVEDQQQKPKNLKDKKD